MHHVFRTAGYPHGCWTRREQEDEPHRITGKKTALYAYTLGNLCASNALSGAASCSATNALSYELLPSRCAKRGSASVNMAIAWRYSGIDICSSGV